MTKHISIPGDYDPERRKVCVTCKLDISACSETACSGKFWIYHYTEEEIDAGAARLLAAIRNSAK